ncbi:uncharacterized protein [Spinacia oleracea]|nr:uncharacterized protein LOC110802131 isoform X2 [Spinacia oleracea]
MGNSIQGDQTKMSAAKSSLRGCASKFPQPLSSEDLQEAQTLGDTVYQVNHDKLKLQDIIYRSSEGDKDVLRQVFRWDLAPYGDVFQHGFQAHHKNRVHDKTSYDLHSYVQGRGRPLDSRKTSDFAFISTTVSNSWYPPVATGDGNSKTVEVYRYEIYAPGGIWTSLTLGEKNDRKFKRLDEVVFVGGIASQYVRSAQLFRLTGNPDGTTTIERANNVLLINNNFSPQSHPLKLLNIQNPVSDYTDSNRTPLSQTVYQSSNNNNNNTNIINWYANDVANLDVYMSAALRSSHTNEAYYVLQNLVTLLNYDPGGTHDHVVDGPSFVSEMFKSLEYTPFGEHGIDGALKSRDDEAFIFCANLCLLINYAPDTRNDTIVKGPMTVVEMFPFLKGTVFENGIDSACELKSAEDEAYFFKGNLCAHINYGSNPQLITQGQIGQFIPLLKGTVFEGIGVDASYASHAENEVAYYFKYNNYGQINVNVEDGVEYLYGVFVMGDNAPVIHSFVPQKNRGLDIRSNPGALPSPDEYDYDEL